MNFWQVSVSCRKLLLVLASTHEKDNIVPVNDDLRERNLVCFEFRQLLTWLLLFRTLLLSLGTFNAISNWFIGQVCFRSRIGSFLRSHF